jgi:type I restriction enzyme M protein
MAKRHSNRMGDLESVFLRLEELVLANYGEDEFEEVFKLLIAKLRDERSGESRRFVAHDKDTDTFAAVDRLLGEVEEAWPGILGEEPRSQLTPEHLQVCVQALAPHTLSGSNLQAMDGFFEFLVSKSAKGAKGQYFTPRHVVELCVRMLRPRQAESMLDPGCGSGGFLVHVLEYVREAEGLQGAALRDYGSAKLWGFDLDGRAVRVAKALMLLAGDGEANIVRLNSLLRPDMEAGRPDDPSALTIEEECRSRQREAGGFDIILTNPPFAGEVRERHILDGYSVSQGKARVERDVLFLERCVKLLRPGGRMGIVLPHNKFAGTGFRTVREWLLREARVDAVVGLGRNTFHPHTHQKASVLFVQRRLPGEVANPEEAIFFAVSEKDGKNSKGQFVRRDGFDEGAPVWESVDHDLADVTAAFHGFVAEEALSAWG